MTLFQQFLAQAAAFTRKHVREESTLWRWATVTSVDPVLIRYDGTPSPAIIPPTVLGPPVTVGDRVRTATVRGKTVIWGTGEGGTPGPGPAGLDITRLAPEFVGRIGIPGNRVIQSFDLDPDTGEYYLTQAVDSEEATSGEDTIVYRVSRGGIVLDQARLIGAGHGSSIAVERVGSHVWLWLRWSYSHLSNHVAKGVRVRWRTGKVYSNASNITTLPALPSSEYTLYALDHTHGRVAVREQIGGTTGGTETFYLYDKAQFLTGTATPLHVVGPLPYHGPQGAFQGHTTHGDSLFVSYGGSLGTPAESPSYVCQFDWATGTKTVLDVTSTALDRDGKFVGGMAEAEGNAIWVGPTGVPQLLYGLAVGALGGHRQFWVQSFRPVGAEDLGAHFRKPAGVPFVMAAGRAVGSVSGGHGRFPVSFPAGRFTVPPIVTVSADSSASAVTDVAVDSVTTEGFDVILSRSNSQDTPVMWQAVQMTTADAEG